MERSEDSKPSDKFKFIPSTRQGTCRQSTLLDSTSRSHAAKIGHARRKEQQGRCQYTESGVDYGKADQHKSISPQEHWLLSPWVRAGNSDPFSSTALVVTPHLNLLLTFVRDAVFPAIYGTLHFRKCSADQSSNIDMYRTSSIVSAQGARRAWQQQVDSLSDVGMALASLAPWSDILPRFIGVFPKKWQVKSSLEMRARSVRLLRQKLASNESSPKYNRATLLHIFWLFRAELFARNFEAATVHGKVLRSIVQDAFSDGTIDLQILIQFLFVDVDAAVMNMRRTIFDVNGWFMRVLDKPWTMIKSLFASPEPEAVIISPTIECEALINAVIEFRYQLTFHQRPFGPGDCCERGPGDLMFSMVASRSFVDMGCLINLYLNLTTTGTKASATLSTGQRYTQACLCLCVLFVIRSIAHNAMIQNVDIRDASATLMSHLKPLMVQTFVVCTDEELAIYGQAHLWILFIIVLYDQRAQMSSLLEDAPSSPNPINNEVSIMLATQARKEKISTWEEMRRLGTRFIRTDLLQPRGEEWFEDTIAGRIWSAGSEDSGYISSGRR